MEKTISIVSLVVAVAAGAVAIGKPDTSKMVAASVSEDDVAVTKVVQQAGVKQVTCKIDWVDLGKGPVQDFVCSDTGYDPTRNAWLHKRCTGDCTMVVFDPNEAADGNVKVAVTLAKEPVRPMPAPIVVEEAKPVEAEAVTP